MSPIHIEFNLSVICIHISYSPADVTLLNIIFIGKITAGQQLECDCALHFFFLAHLTFIKVQENQ